MPKPRRYLSDSPKSWTCRKPSCTNVQQTTLFVVQQTTLLQTTYCCSHFFFPVRAAVGCSPVMHLRLSVPAVPACVTSDVFRVMYATVRASCVLLLTLLLLIVFESTRTSIMGELCLLCFNFNWRSHVAVTRCYNVFARVGGIKRGNDAFLSSCQRVLGHCKWLRTTS